MLEWVPGVHRYSQHRGWSDRRTWSYGGSVFDAYGPSRRRPWSTGQSEIQPVVVTLGSNGYGFRRLIKGLLLVLPAGADVPWQTGETDVSTSGSYARLTSAWWRAPQWGEVIRSWGGGAEVCTRRRERAARLPRATSPSPVIVTGARPTCVPSPRPRPIRRLLDAAKYQAALVNADVVVSLTTEPGSVMRAADEAVYGRRPLIISAWPLAWAPFPHALHVPLETAALGAAFRTADARFPELASLTEEARELQIARFYEQRLAWPGRLAQPPAASAYPRKGWSSRRNRRLDPPVARRAG